MAFDSITDALFGPSKVTKIGELEVDATVARNFTFDATMTEHPVEEGSDITDHHQPLPDLITIEGVVSSAPLGTMFPGESTVNAIASVATGNASFIKDAMDLLIKYWKESTLLEIETTKLPFTDMLITSLRFDEDGSTGDRLPFVVTLKKARIVKTGTAGLLALGKDVAKQAKEKDAGGEDSKTEQAKPKADKGKQSSTEASPAENNKSQSILAGMVF